jgi:hypothetical protein
MVTIQSATGAKPVRKRDDDIARRAGPTRPKPADTLSFLSGFSRAEALHTSPNPF